jgi:hypothetical protein
MVLNFRLGPILYSCCRWAVGQVPADLAAYSLLEAEEDGGCGIPTPPPLLVPAQSTHYTADIISNDRLDGYMVDA